MQSAVAKYFLFVKVLSRNKGSSVARAAAYRAGERILESRRTDGEAVSPELAGVSGEPEASRSGERIVDGQFSRARGGQGRAASRTRGL